MAFIAAAIPAIISAVSSTATAVGSAGAAIGSGIGSAASAIGSTLGISGATAAGIGSTTVPGLVGGAGASTVGLVDTGASAALAASTGATPWLAEAGTFSSLASGVVGGVGQIEQASAQAAASKYSAQVAGINQKQALTNEQLASESGDIQADIQSRRTRALVGEEIANAGASGLDVRSGSNIDTQISSQIMGKVDALTVRSNAAREAYGYQTQADTFAGEKSLKEAEGKNAQTAGGIGAASTLLGAGGTAASNYSKWKLSSGIGYA